MLIENDKFRIEWAIPKRVIQITYKMSLQREDVIQVAQELEKFYEAGTAPLHVISDSKDMPSMDADLATLRDTFTIWKRDKWGWLILTGTNRLLNFFAAMLQKAFNLNIRHADSAEDALESLRRLDEAALRWTGLALFRERNIQGVPHRKHLGKHDKGATLRRCRLHEYPDALEIGFPVLPDSVRLYEDDLHVSDELRGVPAHEDAAVGSDAATSVEDRGCHLDATATKRPVLRGETRSGCGGHGRR